MQDMITKGEGNSRFLKSVSDFLTRYPTYEDMAAALVAGTFPVDFNGLNQDGILQDGTPLNKGNLLSDETAQAIGKEVSTPNEALAQLHKFISSVQSFAGTRCQIASGVYAGDDQTAKTFVTGFTPKLFICVKTSSWGDTHYYANTLCVYAGQSRDALSNVGSRYFSVSGDRIQIQSGSATYAMNDPWTEYAWTAIG